MQIRAIFDKRALDKNLHTGWGVSFLIEGKILFDTGEKGGWLLENMRYLGINVDDIEAVVVSHDHWDHWGGLWDLLEKRKGLKVYICPRFSREFKDKANGLGAQLIEAEKFTEIAKDIFTSGEIAGAYHGKYMAEQAAVLKTENGLTVLTGCAHPGIVKILEKVKEKFPGEKIYLALGGFHLMESDKRAVEIVAGRFKQLGVEKAGPTHCSGEAAQEIFKRIYADDYIFVNAGQTIEC